MLTRVFIAAAVTAAAACTPVFATTYENRAKAVREASANAEVAKLKAMYLEGARAWYNRMQSFGAKNGGIRTSTCAVALVECGTSYYGGMCMPAKDKDVSLGTLITGKLMSVRGCDVDMGNGLACWVYHRYVAPDFQKEVYEASCYDSAKRHRTITLSGGGKAKKKSKKG